MLPINVNIPQVSLRELLILHTRSVYYQILSTPQVIYARSIHEGVNLWSTLWHHEAASSSNKSYFGSNLGGDAICRVATIHWDTTFSGRIMRIHKSEELTVEFGALNFAHSVPISKTILNRKLYKLVEGYYKREVLS